MSASSPVWAARTSSSGSLRASCPAAPGSPGVRGAADPAQALLGDLQRGVAGEDPADGGQGRRRRTAGRPSPAASPPRRPTARRASAADASAYAMSSPSRSSTCWLRVSRPTRHASSTAARHAAPARARPARTAGCAACSAPSLVGERRGSTGRAVLRCCCHRSRAIGHLQDLRGALVDRGDPDVPLDLLDQVGPGVAVPAVRLDRRVGGGVAGLGRHVLGDGALGVQRAVLRPRPRRCGSAVSSTNGARGLEPRRRAARSACACSPASRRAATRPASRLRRVADRPVQGLPAAAQAERGDHQPGVAEDLLGLDQPAALDAADQVLRRHHDVVEEQRRRVGQPDAVLVLRRRGREARGALLDDEPGRPAGGQREDRVGVGDASRC